MVVILEGVDGCGKSTVFENLKKILGESAYFFKESYPGDSLEERQSRLSNIRNFTRYPNLVIYDRATIVDDFIYNDVIACKPPMLKWEEVLPVLNDCLIIYLDCDQDTLVKRLRERGDEYINEHQIKQLIAKYDNLSISIPNIEIIDVTNRTEEEVCDEVYDAILANRTALRKRPKLAHILPRDLLEMTVNNQYHMSLAHLVISDEKYRNFYKRMVACGRYVLMDNGAAEGAQLRNEELLKCWIALRPTELILPDTLCDKDDTLRKVGEAIPYFKSWGVDSYFMAVPQGKTLEEWCECARELINLPEVHSLGISKFLTIQTGDPEVRYKAVEFLSRELKVQNRPDIEVHLLGCDAGASEPLRIFQHFDFVRGCDTALAYIYAAAGKKMIPGSKRPEGEMSFLENTLDSTDPLKEAMTDFNNINLVVNEYGDYTWT